MNENTPARSPAYEEIEGLRTAPEFIRLCDRLAELFRLRRWRWGTFKETGRSETAIPDGARIASSVINLAHEAVAYGWTMSGRLLVAWDSRTRTLTAGLKEPHEPNEQYTARFTFPDKAE